MFLFLNDTSLQGQFSDNQSFRDSFSTLLRIRTLHAFRNRIRIVRSLGSSKVTAFSTLNEALRDTTNREFVRSALTWLDRTGPFVDDERLEEENDYFEYQSIDVTDSALGEAARRIKSGLEAITFSFEGGEIDFAIDPLLIDHGLEEERYGSYSIPNYWAYEKIAQLAEATQPLADSWQSLIESCSNKFENIHFGENVIDSALKQPFEVAIANSVVRLLGILNTYVKNAVELGADSEPCKQIVSDFFTGDRAYFTGESKTNKRDFKDQLTFQDIDNSKKKIFADWHGKVSRGTFRIHFEWPIPNGQDHIKVFYIGPKLTKK